MIIITIFTFCIYMSNLIFYKDNDEDDNDGTEYKYSVF